MNVSSALLLFASYRLQTMHYLLHFRLLFIIKSLTNQKHKRFMLGGTERELSNSVFYIRKTQ